MQTARICRCGQRCIVTRTPYPLCQTCAAGFWQAATAAASQRAKLLRIIEQRPALSDREQAAIVQSLSLMHRDETITEWFDKVQPGGLSKCMMRREAVREAVSNGMTSREAALRFGLSRDTIHRYLGRPPRKRVTDAVCREVLALGAQGCSCREIARRTGFGLAAITKIRADARRKNPAA